MKTGNESFELKSGDRLIVGSDDVGIALLPTVFFEKKMKEYFESVSDKQ